MIVPYKPVYLPKAYKAFRYIIVHDFTCQFDSIDKTRIDNKTSQMQGARVYNWMFNKEWELPYHFVCEKIGLDVETFMARPLCYYCEYPDIPDQYLNSIHIALAGDYNIIAPTQRVYQQLAYRSISSMVRWFNIKLNQVYLHWEVSTNKDLHCPGDFFRKDRLDATTKQYSLMKK